MGDASAQRRNARGTSRHGPERSGRKMTTVNREQRKAGRDFLGRLATRWGWRTQHYPRPRPMDRALIAAHGKALTMLATTLQRSEERRVGTECVSKGSSRWGPDH